MLRALRSAMPPDIATAYYAARSRLSSAYILRRVLSRALPDCRFSAFALIPGMLQAMPRIAYAR